MARGFALACNIEQVEKLCSAPVLLEGHQINKLEQMIGGFATIGYPAQVNMMLQNANASKLITEAASDYAINFHFVQMEKCLKEGTDIEAVAKSLKKYFISEKMALRTLSLIHDDKLRESIALTVELRIEINVLALLPRAKIIHRLMTNKHLNYKDCLDLTDLTKAQRQASQKPEVQTWFLECLKVHCQQMYALSQSRKRKFS